MVLGRSSGSNNDYIVLRVAVRYSVRFAGCFRATAGVGYGWYILRGSGAARAFTAILQPICSMRVLKWGCIRTDTSRSPTRSMSGTEIWVANFAANQSHPFVSSRGVRSENQSNSHTRVLAGRPVFDHWRFFFHIYPQLIITIG